MTMAQMTVTLELKVAPAFIAGLVKEGLTFKARQDPRDPEYLIITLTGGY